MTTHLLPGWTRYHGDLLEAFWLDGYQPEAEQDSERSRALGRRGPDGLLRFSEVCHCEKDGVPPMQWVNITEDKALVALMDGKRTESGQWRFFASPGAGHRPHEVTPHGQFYYHCEMSTEHLLDIKSAAKEWAVALIGATTGEEGQP